MSNQITQNEQNVYRIFHFDNQKTTFNEDEAYNLISLLINITSKTKNKVNVLNSRIDFFKNQQSKAQEIEADLNSEIEKWSDKMQRLGVVPTALFKVLIPSEQFNYTWEYPNASLQIEVLEPDHQTH